MGAEFIQQVNVMSDALLKGVTDYIEYEKFIRAKYEVLSGKLTPENLTEIALKGSHTAGVMRNVYINYVRRHEFDIRALWDACIETLFIGLVWMPILEEYFRDNMFKEAINKTKFPEWTKIGIAGGSWAKIKRMLEEIEVDG